MTPSLDDCKPGTRLIVEPIKDTPMNNGLIRGMFRPGQEVLVLFVSRGQHEYVWVVDPEAQVRTPCEMLLSEMRVP